MSLHSYSRCWLHLIWGTLRREKVLHQEARKQLSVYFKEYASSKDVFLKINFVNADHVHLLLDLPTQDAIQDLIRLFKGSSSHWVNQQQLLKGKFAWGRGYGAFSVSQSNVDVVAQYIATQEEHHHRKSFQKEYKAIIQAYQLQWAKEENR